MDIKKFIYRLARFPLAHESVISHIHEIVRPGDPTMPALLRACSCLFEDETESTDDEPARRPADPQSLRSILVTLGLIGLLLLTYAAVQAA